MAVVGGCCKPVHGFARPTVWSPPPSSALRGLHPLGLFFGGIKIKASHHTATAGMSTIWFRACFIQCRSMSANKTFHVENVKSSVYHTILLNDELVLSFIQSENSHVFSYTSFTETATKNCWTTNRVYCTGSDIHFHLTTDKLWAE